MRGIPRLKPSFLLLLSPLLLTGCPDRERHAPSPPEHPTAFLVCSAKVAIPDTTITIGRGGGRAHAGPHELTVPAEALPQNVNVRMSDWGGDTLGVQIYLTPSPRLRRSVTLSLDVVGCTAGELGEDRSRWFIWRFPGATQAGGQRIGTFVEGTRVRALLTETSRFAIAE